MNVPPVTELMFSLSIIDSNQVMSVILEPSSKHPQTDVNYGELKEKGLVHCIGEFYVCSLLHFEALLTTMQLNSI